jgi:hypothetical protein
MPNTTDAWQPPSLFGSERCALESVVGRDQRNGVFVPLLTHLEMILFRKLSKADGRSKMLTACQACAVMSGPHNCPHAIANCRRRIIDRSGWNKKRNEKWPIPP